MLLALTACGSSDDEEDPYIEVTVGDVLYSDDNCSVIIVGLEYTDDDNTVLTLNVVDNYAVSMWFTVSAYDTSAYNAFLESYKTDKHAIAASVGSSDLSTIKEGTEGETTELDYPFEFSGKYVYFSIDFGTYSEVITQEQVDSDTVDVSIDDTLYSQAFLISTAE